MRVLTTSREETVNLGIKIGKTFKGPQVIALKGGMGAGKTALCEGIAKALNINQYIVSPTFNIVNVYYGTKTLYHFDMYRVGALDDLLATGFYDYLDDPNGVLFIEWSENVLDALPNNTKFITIEYKDENTRLIFSEDF